MSQILSFTDDACTRHDLAGGKGRNLAILTAAGFTVPPGFVISADAYARFMTEAGLDARIRPVLDELDFADLGQVEATTTEFRSWILDASIPPDTAEEIVAAYRALGDHEYVAVRSSGTAEDLADASFAGLHDTYLDIRGIEELLLAVRRCWASLWTARATSYRSAKGFDSLEAKLPVVVQLMVKSDIAGVMFTANPLSAATNEIVINSSWGLGEAVVSGHVTPDEYILDWRDLRLKRSAIGEKRQEIVRDAAHGTGTITREVDGDRRTASSLSDDELTQLGRLGRRITKHYGSAPQDIEWAFSDGTLYVLQSRNVTGVPFTWDDEMDAWQTSPDDPDTVWTLQWSNDFWNGPASPLHYSVRAWEQTQAHQYLRRNLGVMDLAERRVFKFWRGRVYYNTEIDGASAEMLVAQSMRAGMLANVHPDDRAAILAKPLDKNRLVRTVLRQLADPKSGPYSWLKLSYAYMVDFSPENEGLSYEELAQLTDRELKAHIVSRIHRWRDFNNQMWLGFWTYGTWAMQGTVVALQKWLPGLPPEEFGSVLQDLISGLPLPVNKQAEERQELWRLGNVIRESAWLRQQFEEAENGQDFLDRLKAAPDGEFFAAEYATFLREYGSRGTADRDWFYDRRIENPQLDYLSFEAMLKADRPVAPLEYEARRRAKREETTARVFGLMRGQTLGALKVEAMKFLLNYTYKFLTLREDQRHYLDIVGQSKKRAWLELGRRLVDRGVFDEVDDVLFVTWDQAFELIDGVEDDPELLRTKIENRREEFMKVHRREASLPLYLRDQLPHGISADEDEDDGDGRTFQGAGHSEGRVTARARVVPNLDALSTLEPDEILICNATDPGWATAFLVIKGLIIEDGGLLSHGACLSREYGLPAITLPNAMKKIPDGALITLDGGSGRVWIEDEESAPPS